MQLILLNGNILQLGSGGGTALFSIPGNGIVNTSLSINTSSMLPGGLLGSSYNFSFTASGGTPPYTWSLVSGSLVSGISLTSTGILMGVPANAETDTIVVHVTDSTSATVQGTFILTIASSASNALVITSTSPLPSITAGTPYSLTFAASGGTSPYTWSVISGAFPAELTLSSAGVLSGTVHPESSTPFNAVVKVTDNVGSTATGAFTLAVTNNAAIPNVPLSVNTSTASGYITVGATVDTSGPAATSITITSTDNTLGPVAVGPSLTATFSGLTNGRQYQFSVTANNSIGESIPALSNVVTVGTTSTSTLSIVTTSPLPSTLVNTAYNATLIASGGTAPYTWSLTSGTLPTGIVLSSSGVLSGTVTQVITDNNLVFRVTDSVGSTASGTFTIVIPANSGGIIPNAPLSVSASAGNGYAVISVNPDTSGGTATSYTASTLDGTIQHSALALPLSVYGLTNGTSYQFYVTANNSTGVSARAYTNAITPSSSAVALSVLSTSLPSGTVGSFYTTTLSATGGTSPYMWSISTGTLPSGLSLAASTGIISGTPTVSISSGIAVTVTDNVGSTAVQALTLSVDASNSGSLAISSPATLPTATVSTAYTDTLAATGGTAPYSWAISSGSLPAGLSLSSAGVLSGTPTVAGTSSGIVIAVTDSSGTGTTAQPILVSTTDNEGSNPGNTQVPNGITSTAPQLLGAGHSMLAFSTVATYGGTHSSAYLTDTEGNTYTQLQLLTPATSGNILSAQETVMWYCQSIKGDTSSKNVWTSSFSSGDSDYQAFYGLEYSGVTSVVGSSALIQNNLSPGTNNVNSGTSITVTSAQLPCTLIGFCFNLSQTGTGYTPTPGSNMTQIDTTWGFYEGTGDNVCVATRNITTAGTYQAIFNQPSSAVESMQTFAVILKGTSSAGGTTASQTFSIPVIAASLSLATTSLSSGTVGTTYSQTLAATGGTKPYTWSISSGSLPNGLALAASTGIISGNPTTAGTSSITIAVTDSASHVASNTFSLSVVASSVGAPGAPTGVSATAGNGQASVSFSAPSSNGGAAITSYTVTSAPSGFTATGSGSPLTVTGLSNGTAYTFTVKATNSAGTGVASAASNSVTPVASGGGTAPTQVQMLLQGQTSQNQASDAGGNNRFAPQNANYTMIGWLGVSGATSYNIYRATIPVGSQAINPSYSLYTSITAAAAASAYTGYVNGSSAPHQTAVNCAFGDTAATGCVNGTRGGGTGSAPSAGDLWAATGYSYKVSAIVSGVEGAQSAAHYAVYIENGLQIMQLNSFNNEPSVINSTAAGTDPLGNSRCVAWNSGESPYWNPYCGNGATEWNLNIRAFNYVEMYIKAAQNDGSSLTNAFENEGDNYINGGTGINFSSYSTPSGNLQSGVWTLVKIPLSVIFTDSTRGRQNAFYKCIPSVNGMSGTWYIGAWRFVT